MSGRIKEDERNERTIRNLLKLPANKRCINCNSLGPQYVCTNFWTFVCTTCSGIHREFTHRVKSVSMAKFTSQEVSALQNGGNERAKSIYFKDWDTQSHSYPNNSNVERLRDFIRHVYADKRFSGERSDVKPPRGEDFYENRTDVSRKGSRSPPYEDTYHHRHNDKPSPGGRSDDSYSKYGDRSPEHDREFRYSSDQGKSPNRPQIVNDWRREDRFSKASKVDDHRSSDGDSLSEGRSPDYEKDINMSSPPVVRPVRDILGDNFIPLMIGPPTPIGAISTDSTAKRAVSSSSFGSSDGNQVEPKKETLESLIDFDADPEPSAVAASKSQIEETNPVFATIEPTSLTSDNNWASFDFSTGAKLPQVEHTSTNNLDSLLLQLTAPAQSGQMLAPGGTSSPEVLVSQVNMPSCSDVGFTATPISSGVGFDSMTVPGSGLGMQYPQQTNSLLSGEQNSQSIQQYSNSPPGHLPQYISKTSQEVANGFETQGIKAETNSSGRSALPEDLFAASYHQPLTAPQGWPTSHPARMGFTMHYSVPPTTHNFQQPSKSSNPFDFGHESSPAPALSFPSMAPLHGALPTIANPSSGVLYTPSVSDPSPSYVQPSMPSYTSQFPLSYATGMPSGSHLTQQVLQTVPVASNPQEVFGVGDSSFHSFPSANQTVGGDYLPPAAPNSFPGGNPFG